MPHQVRLGGEGSIYGKSSLTETMLTKQRGSSKVLLIVIVAAVAVTALGASVFWYWLGRQPNGYLDYEVWDQKNFPVAVGENASDIALIVNGGSDRLREYMEHNSLPREGHYLEVPRHTLVRVLGETDVDGTRVCRVRILSGEYRGTEGWVFCTAVKKGAPPSSGPEHF